MASLALRRLQKEFSDFPRDNPDLSLCEDDDIQDLTRWKVKLVGAKDTIYEGEAFCLQFTFSLSYPIESPEVVFVDNIPVHEHVYSNGHICLSTLYDEWAPCFSVQTVCLSIISMLSSATEKKAPMDNDTYCAMNQGQSPKKTRFFFHDGIIIGLSILCFVYPLV